MVDRIEARIESLIQRIETGEPIDHDREIVLAGLEFVADSLKVNREADGNLFAANNVTGS